jgi:hypothetical protein
MIIAALTSQSQAWVDLHTVGIFVAALAGTYSAFRTRLNSGKINEIHVNTNGNLSALVAEVKALKDEVVELKAERNTARAETIVAKAANHPQEPTP